VRFLPFVDDVLVFSNAVANPILVADRTSTISGNQNPKP